MCFDSRVYVEARKTLAWCPIYKYQKVPFIDKKFLSEIAVEIFKKNKMTQSNNKLSMINILHFLFFLAISPAKGAIIPSMVTCTPGISYDCCWVIRSWQWMGKTTSVDHTSPNACCDMEGVTCTHDETGVKVTHISWIAKSLKNSIPPSLGRLTNLRGL